MLSMLLYLHKATGNDRDPQRLVILVHKLLFCMQKPQVGSGTTETCNSGSKVAVLHAQNHK